MRRLTILLAALGALLLVPAASAFAEELPFQETFGSASQPSFANPEGMAVDQATGDLLVIEAETGSISRWNPDGSAAPFSALSGSNTIDGAGGADETPEEGLFFGSYGEVQIAVDSTGGATKGDIYVAQAGAHVVDVFASSGKYLGQLTNVGEACGVAVGPAGVLYVGSYGEPEGEVHKYVPAGAFPVNGDNTLNFATGLPSCTLAAGLGPSAGAVFVSGYLNRVVKFDGTSGAEDYVVVEGTNATPGVDPATGNLFTENGEELEQYDASGPSATLVTKNAGGGGIITGIAVGGAARALYVAREGVAKVEVLTLPEVEEGGPTNRRTLTLTKSPSPSAGTGVGTVKSKPKGINCASACSEAEASLYKETTVLISAKAATGSTLAGWEGCESTTVISATEGTCTVKMTEDQAVEAQFGGTSKAIPNPQELTLAKAGTGFGTVKSKPAGIACEADCTKTAALYAGELTEPKPKAATTVILTEAKAPGSVFSGWSGCDEVNGEGQCVVAMSEAKEVTAEFTALPSNTLSVAKSPSPAAGTGLGTVKSKPKGINCASACSEAEASFAEDTTVVLAAKAATGSTLAGWEGCESTTVISATEGTCTVAMSEAQAVTAEFGGASKAIPNPQELTLAKAGTGFGTVKSKPGGIACEALCTATTALYAGELTEPKPKAAATVILTATSAPGSKPVEWSGCDEVNGEGQCVVAMTEAKEVTASFDELE